MKLILTAVVLLALVVVALYSLLIRPWHLKWGATEAEVSRALPGDDIVPGPKIAATHAITIQAPAADVWPWLVQMGQGRAGFYSYEWIENLMGLTIRNANQILREYQNLKVGDTVPLAPDGTGVPVAVCEPNEVLVLGGRVDSKTQGALALHDSDPNAFFETSWTFFLQPVDPYTTRLIERFRTDWGPESFANTFFYRVILEPGSFIMERAMLLGIKQRVEAAAERRGR